MSVTGNPIRDRMIANAIREAQAAGKPVTVAVLGLEELPSDFDLVEDELQGVLATMNAEPAAVDVQVDNEVDIKVDPILDVSVDAEPEALAPTMTMDEARDRLVRLNSELAEARGAVLAATNRQREARTKLAEAITTFQTGFAKLTPTELLRQHVREQSELRARGKASPARQSQPGNSAVDRQAFYSRGGSANTGYGTKWRRGAYGIDSYGARNSDPRRGPVAKG